MASKTATSSTRSRGRRPAKREAARRPARVDSGPPKTMTLKGRLMHCETVIGDRRERFAIDIVSKSGARRRVMFDSPKRMRFCHSLMRQSISVRAYREDGMWELDSENYLSPHTAPIQCGIAPRKRIRRAAPQPPCPRYNLPVALAPPR